MHDAFLAKVKSAGPVSNVCEELDRSQFWLPAHLQPLVPRMREWMWRYSRESSAERRLQVENEAMQDVCLYLRLHRHQPDAALVLEFARKSRMAMQKSRQARAQVLEGDMSVAADFDEALFVELLSCLRNKGKGKDAAIAAWLDRLMKAWQKQRAKDGKSSAMPAHKEPAEI